VFTLLFIYLVISQSVPTATPQHQTSAAIAALQASSPNVEWDVKTAVTADITGDGIEDTVVIGYNARAVWLGFVPGMKSSALGKPQVIELVVCRRPVHIQLSPATCEGSTGPLLGCKVVKGTSEIAVVDDACDAYHFYWDRTLKTLDWWRL
jgi:hypothetical protein